MQERLEGTQVFLTIETEHLSCVYLQIPILMCLSSAHTTFVGNMFIPILATRNHGRSHPKASHHAPGPIGLRELLPSPELRDSPWTPTRHEIIEAGTEISKNESGIRLMKKNCSQKKDTQKNTTSRGFKTLKGKGLHPKEH